MVKEDHGLKQGSAENRKRWTGHIVVPFVLLFIGLMLYGIGCSPNPGGGPGDKPPSRLFHDWPQNRKPLFVLLLSGQQQGYLQPCGCSPIQYGGLERRYNLIQQLKKEKGWPIVALDLGDIAQERGPQKQLKYVTSMEALKKLDYTAVGMGRTEGLLPIIEALASFALNNQKNNQPLPPHVLIGNLQQRDKDFPGAEAVVFGGGVGSLPKIGITSVVAPSVVKEINDPMVKFDALGVVMPKLLDELQRGKAEFKVLLFQGNDQEAKQEAAAHPGFQVILHLSAEEEPPENPIWVNSTMLVNVGHKGRYVGLVGVYAGAKPGLPFEMYYQLLRIGPEYKTPSDKDADNPILGLLDEYARKVQKGDGTTPYLQMYTQTKHLIQMQQKYSGATYIGSDMCKRCHDHAYDVWSKSKHAQAFQTLVNAKRPSLRQFDGECVVCHVTGFEYNSGYRNDTDTPKLKNVGCESCHGPGSEHVKKPHDANLWKLMNPFKAPPNETEGQKGIRLRQLNVFCQHCHDVDNDVGWNDPPVKAGEPPRRWPPINHMTPKD